MKYSMVGLTLFLTTAAVFALGPWDVNSDGCVNISDLAIVGGDFGQIGVDLPSDVNKDGVVNVFDLVLVGSHFGEGSCEPFPPTLLGGAEVSIDQPNLDGMEVGDFFTVNINIANGINVQGSQFDVTFDPTVFSFVSIQNGDFLPGSFVLPPILMAGKVTFVAAALVNPASGNGTLAQATFQIVQLQASTLGLVDIALSDPDGLIGDTSIVTVDIVAVPNPAAVGNPLEIRLDLTNPGDGFNAEFRLWALASGNVTTLVSLSPFVPAGLTLTDFSVFSTTSVPAGLPPVVGFLGAIFDAGNGELLDWDFESVGIGVAPSAADINALRQTATDFLNSGDVNAAPPRPVQELNFNGTAKNPFGQQVNSKGKLTTTWGRIKSQR